MEIKKVSAALFEVSDNHRNFQATFFGSLPSKDGSTESVALEVQLPSGLISLDFSDVTWDALATLTLADACGVAEGSAAFAFDLCASINGVTAYLDKVISPSGMATLIAQMSMCASEDDYLAVLHSLPADIESHLPEDFSDLVVNGPSVEFSQFWQSCWPALWEFVSR